MSQKKKCTAIVLAAGKGSRMQTEENKQFLELGGKPLVYYSLRRFQDSPLIDEIILVTNAGKEEYCRKEITERYAIVKVRQIIPGGAERYDSVYRGLLACESPDYVFIQDSARPFLTEEIIRRAYEEVQKTGACITAVPAKDTIKIAAGDGTVAETPDRSRLWVIQTPQVFEYGQIRRAYEACRERGMEGITDDAMVLERAGGPPIRFSMGSYENIKITTPEDLCLAEEILRRV